MATQIYQTKNITLLDGSKIEVIPLKIKFLRQFMDEFENIHNCKTDDQSISLLSRCVQIAMQQYKPEISDSIEKVEDVLDMALIYEILDVAAGIKINKKSENSVKDQAVESGSSFADLDLAKLESEVFLLGIWKDYQELELSLSMPELIATIEISRELSYAEKKFMAAIQGVDLDKHSNQERGQAEWENMKARVFSKGATNNSKDILALQGQNAKNAGFGIGMGLDYEDLRNK